MAQVEFAPYWTADRNRPILPLEKGGRAMPRTIFRVISTNILPGIAALVLILMVPIPATAAPAAPAPVSAPGPLSATGLCTVYDEYPAHAEYAHRTHTIAPNIPDWEVSGASK